HVELEVHADINTDPHFQSNVALKEAMGYILGMGFVFKAKPDAFASSCCADKVV
ncbi:MAG: ribonuclease H-like YkuK family protein, partial [Saprospiraceae bacterium]